MKLIRCLSCNKVLGEVEGKARIKCKMAGCHAMNEIDTDMNEHYIVKTRDELTKEERDYFVKNAQATFKPNN